MAVGVVAQPAARGGESAAAPAVSASSTISSACKPASGTCSWPTRSQPAGRCSRVPSTTSTWSRRSRRTAKTRARADASSIHCASSSTSTTGPAPSSSPSTASSSAPTASGSASGAGTRCGEVGEELPDHAVREPVSASSPLAQSTRTSVRSARRRRMSVVLPMPAGPLSHSTRGLPARACSSSAFIAASSCARPTKISLDTSPVWPGERPSGSHAPGDLSPRCYSASPSGCATCIAGLDTGWKTR